MIATTLALLLLLIGISIPVGVALGVLGLLLDSLYSMLPLTRAIGELAWSSNNEFLLVAIPLFIMLGEVLLRAGFAEHMYGAMSLWLSWLPGGLMHANIGASTLFSATSGSSVATAATVGTVAIPQIRKWAPKIFHVHGKDATVRWDVIREHGVFGRLPFVQMRTPGFGDSDWVRVISELRLAGYKGVIDIEGWHDPVYRGDLEITGQVAALDHLKQCRGGATYLPNPA